MGLKRFVLLIGLIAMVGILAAACSSDDDDDNGAVSSAGARLDLVMDRGNLIWRGRTDPPGLGFLDANGAHAGFELDLWRAVAAAIFGDASKLTIIPISASERGPTIQAGEVDILSRNVTWTTTRDSQWGNYTNVMFYDGQGFMVPTDKGYTSALDLDGATVCVTSGTTTELNLADFFRQNGMTLETVVYEDTSSVYSAYEQGRCDATTSDKSQLAAIRSGFADPGAHMILAETISQEPLTRVVAPGDARRFDQRKTLRSPLITAGRLRERAGKQAASPPMPRTSTWPPSGAAPDFARHRASVRHALARWSAI